MSSSTPFHLAHQLRRRRRIRRRVVGGLIAVGAAALIAVAVYILAFSSLLAAQHTVVEGTDLLSEQEVSEAAEVPLGTPLLRISERAVGERVLRLPEVLTVGVHRDLPDTVRLSVTERSPVMIIESDTGRQLVDADGVSFDYRDTEEQRLPQAEVANTDPVLLSEVAAVAGALTPELRADAERLTASDRDDISVELADGPQIFFGSAEQSQLKVEVATALLGQDASVIDVSSPGNPVTR